MNSRPSARTVLTSAKFRRVCDRFSGLAPMSWKFREPYVPFVPARWNGVLVVAEAQQLAGRSSPYVASLEGLGAEDRYCRLYLGEQLGGKPSVGPGPRLGVGPWDDGSVKLALLSMNGQLPLNRVAVSNAVPWSRTKSGNQNDNPSARAEKLAAAFWAELLKVWSPRLRQVVLLGKVANRVFDGLVPADRVVRLRLPSPSLVNRVQGMFDPDDLLRRFPEVERAARALRLVPSPSQVFYACHAVSLDSGRKRGFGVARLLQVLQGFRRRQPITERVNVGGGNQKQHWIKWLEEYKGPGAYRRKRWGRDARFAYNHLECPEMILWLAEAARMPTARVERAARVLTRRHNRQDSRTCAAVRKVLPWAAVEARL